MPDIRCMLVSDIHHSENANGGGRYYDDAIKKITYASSIATAEYIQLMFILGDSIDDAKDGTDGRIAEIRTAIDSEYSDSVYWALGNHDCYNANYTKAMWLADTGMSKEYYYVDISNLRYIILDTCYSSPIVSYPTNYNWGTSYISTVQLDWLDRILTNADNEGKFSIVMCHHDMGACSGTHEIQNSDILRGILSKHKVVVAVNGHCHKDTRKRTLGDNIDGNPIHYISLDGCVDGDFETNNAAHYILSINDATGTVNYLIGYYGGGSMATYTWTNGNADGDWENSANWSPSTGYPGTGDTAIFDATSTDAVALPVGLDLSAITLEELRIDAGFTSAISGANYLFINAITLTINGGMNTSRLNGTFDTVNASGGAGAAKNLYFSPVASIGDFNVNMTDDTYIFLQQCPVTGTTTLDSGKIQHRRSAVAELIQNDGLYEFDNTGEPTTALTIADIRGGTFTKTDADAVTITTLIIRGGTLDLNQAGLTITNPIQLYATPTAFSHLNTQVFEVEVKSAPGVQCELTQTVNAYTGDFVSSGKINRRKEPLVIG